MTDTRALAPEVKAVLNGPHALVITDDAEDYIEVEHFPECADTDGRGYGTRCHVGFYEESGITAYFDRVDKEADSFLSAYVTFLKPGRYQIEPWQEKRFSHYYGTTEYDGGLCLVEESAADRQEKP